jgi:hypothetical protein
MHLRDWFHHLLSPTLDVAEQVEKIEKLQAEIKSDLEDVRRRVDPLKKLLLDMEEEFQKHDRSDG